MGQASLLRERRFLPLFVTQFLGAFNDNLFKNALMISIVYRSATLAGMDSQEVVAISAGLFILPFFLFSALAGQFSDKYNKTRLICVVKAGEIAIMAAAGLGFWLDSLPLLLSVLFLMGLQSTFFGPAKYSILPELLSNRELTGGNALVETGTFLAILLGTIAGGFLVAGDHLDLIGFLVVSVAVLGFAASLGIPQTRRADPGLALSLNQVRPLLETYRAVRRSHSVFLSVLAISWFWFIGASFLTLLPSFGKSVLGANETIITLLLALFCVGIAAGSLLCERLGGRKLELGLVPIGSIGLSLAAFDLYFTSSSLDHLGPELIGLSAFLDHPGSWRMMADFFLLALSGGFFTVPLYTLIQERSRPETRSRVIAGNNILSALFMVASALLLMALPRLGVTIPQTFALLGIVNALVAIYIYTVIPEFLLRFVAWTIANLMYRIRVTGDENIPERGAAVLVANHVTFVDWLIVGSACQRPVRFVMHYQFLKIPMVKFLFRDARVIPIASAKESEEILHAAFERVASELEGGNVICIFPEGRLTPDGRMGRFRPGIEKVIARTPVPVVPMALGGLWGSVFSRKDVKASHLPFRKIWSRIRLDIGEPVPPAQVTAALLESRVAELGGSSAGGDVR
jgi:1-acyl-sn-glycerol-3-phosphate acyltransferase